MLEPELTYQMILPEETSASVILPKLRQLEEEEPELHIIWNEELQEIQVQIMGEVQLEILKSLIKERFDVDVEFGQGNIVYKETIADVVEGVGHFEPLRHYAEVHLLMEPLERGSGVVIDTQCSEDVLDKNWQRLIITHLLERDHRGVLTGAPITDIKITLVAGRAHQKHTEGGDFRQATYRAVRQGLRMAQSVLLEPYYKFRLEVPQQMIGRAMTDIEKMQGTFDTPDTAGEMSVLQGIAPVSTMQGYQKEVLAYSKGMGRLFTTLNGYDICHNEEEIIEDSGYDPDRDLENPCGSVFCSHGAGYNVAWNEVPEHMHLESVLAKEIEEEEFDEYEWHIRLVLEGEDRIFMNYEIIQGKWMPSREDREYREEILEGVDEAVSTLERMISEERVEELLSTLTDLQRKVVHTHLFHGLSFTEAAKHLGMTRQNLTGIYNAAIYKIQKKHFRALCS